jgi:hypothetical protein
MYGSDGTRVIVGLGRGGAGAGSSFGTVFVSEGTRVVVGLGGGGGGGAGTLLFLSRFRFRRNPSHCWSSRAGNMHKGGAWYLWLDLARR